MTSFRWLWQRTPLQCTTWKHLLPTLAPALPPVRGLCVARDCQERFTFQAGILWFWRQVCWRMLRCWLCGGEDWRFATKNQYCQCLRRFAMKSERSKIERSGVWVPALFDTSFLLAFWNDVCHVLDKHHLTGYPWVPSTFSLNLPFCPQFHLFTSLSLCISCLNFSRSWL